MCAARLTNSVKAFAQLTVLYHETSSVRTAKNECVLCDSCEFERIRREIDASMCVWIKHIRLEQRNTSWHAHEFVQCRTELEHFAYVGISRTLTSQTLRAWFKCGQVIHLQTFKFRPYASNLRTRNSATDANMDHSTRSLFRVCPTDKRHQTSDSISHRKLTINFRVQSNRRNIADGVGTHVENFELISACCEFWICIIINV